MKQPSEMSAEELIAEMRRRGVGMFVVEGTVNLAYGRNEPPPELRNAWNAKLDSIRDLLVLYEDAEQAADSTRPPEGVA